MTAFVIIVLLVAAMVFIVAEFFIPVMGIVAVAAVLAIGGAVTLAFMHDATAGVLVLLGSLIFFPIYVALLIRALPNSPLGKRAFLKQAGAGERTPEQQSLAKLVGLEGVAETPLRLSGAVRINGKRYQAMAESDHIDAGQPVRVLRFDGMDLIVAPVE